MSITPNDIHNKDFSTKFKGFDPEEVNDFLDEVKKELEHLIRENKDLEKRVKFNEEKVEYFTSIQETLNKSIIVAQEAADRLRENARKDAEIIIFEAEKTAEELLKEAAEKATQINRETDAIKKETRIFRQRLQILSQTQLEMIKNEEWDMVLNTPSQIEVTPPTIDSIIEKRAKTAKDKLLNLMNEKGLTDVFFVMDYADGDSPFYDEGGGCHCQVNEKYHLVILKKEEESTLHRKFDKLLETNLGKVYVSSRYEMMFDQKNVVDYSVDKYGFYLKSEAGILSMRLNIDFIA